MINKFVYIVVIVPFVLFACNNNSDEKNNKPSDSLSVLGLEEKSPDLFRLYKVIEQDQANFLELNITMVGGILNITEGQNHMLTSGFSFSGSNKEPLIEHSIRNQRAIVVIKQESANNVVVSQNNKNLWNLAIVKDIPTEINIQFGSGSAIFEKRNIDIRQFNMVLGIGKSLIDLSGNWEKSAQINIIGGIGRSVIILPKDIGLLVELENDIGQVDLQDFKQKTKTTFYNQNFDKTDITLRVNISSGFGKIEVKQK